MDGRQLLAGVVGRRRSETDDGGPAGPGGEERAEGEDGLGAGAEREGEVEEGGCEEVDWEG